MRNVAATAARKKAEGVYGVALVLLTLTPLPPHSALHHAGYNPI
jgi:hypothetical protein